MANIVHFGKYYFPDLGGIESVTSSLARGASYHGHNVTVVCFNQASHIDEEVIDGVLVLRAPISKIIASQPLGLKYILYCLRAAKSAEIIHMHAPNMLAAFCVLMLPRKKKVLVHWHSDVVGKGLLGLLSRPIQSALLSRANIILAATQAYADASTPLVSYRKKVTIVPFGISLPLYSNSGVFQKDLEDKILGRKIILSVGRLVPYKGFKYLISAANNINNDALVVIVGSGPLRESLQRQIIAEGLSDRVYLAGIQSAESLHALFERAYIFCLPSIERSEAFGIVQIEAMSYALPVIATNVPGSGVAWVNENGVSGINVPIRDPLLLASACNEILNSDQLRLRFSAGARKRFLDVFTEDIFVKNLIKIYETLL